MALFITALALGMISTSASNPRDIAMQQLGEVELKGLTFVGAFLQEHAVPAPWMEHQIFSNRRLQAMGSLSEACKVACPQAQTVMQTLQQKMTNAMASHQGALAQGSGSTDLAQMMKNMEPAIKSMLDITFQDMCENKATYHCIGTNHDTCSSDSSSTMMGGMGGMGGMGSITDPFAMTSKYETTLDCFCDVCPGSRQAYVDMTTATMSLFMNALGALGGMMGSEGDSQSSLMDDEVKQDLLQGMCPMIGMQRCFDANPTQCSHMSDGEAQQAMHGLMPTGNASDISAIQGLCDAAGISTAASKEPAVSTLITIAGIDFAKVESNMQFQNDLVSQIKSEFLTKLSGYVADDISVSLSAGSVKASVTIDPLPGSKPSEVENVVISEKTQISNNILTDVKAMPEISTVVEDGITKDQLSISMTDATTSSSSIPPESSAAAGVFLSYKPAMLVAIGGLLAQ